LKESRRQLETLMQNLPGMAYRFGYEHGRKVLFLSNGSEPLTGYTVAELSSGQPHPREISHPEDLPFGRQKTREAVHDRRSFEMEYRIRTKNGPEKWVLSRGQGVYAEDGRLRFIEGLVIDISMRKLVEAPNLHIERRMQETQKRESLGLLAGGVAHDFNNLLTTILGNATMARLDGSGDRGAADNLAQIEQAARHAATLCKQMLAYAGQGQLTKENVDLNQVIREMLPLVQASVGNSVTLAFQAGENLPSIHADPAEISQVVMNLVINAGEAMNGGEGTVAITTAVRLIEPARLQLCVPSSELPSSRCLVLTIADTGSGMPADVIKRIFDPFFSTKFEDRGLGLAAVIGIVRGHHAALQVESEPGRGTCFTVMFPLPETAEAERPPVALIVDDDEPVREVTGELMRSLGYVAETAASGEEAIARVQAYPARYAVVLLDCVMPRVSGEHALTVLQGIRADLPVILMSGNNERGSQNGAVPFLTKPFSRAILEETLRRIRPDDSSV
ncbi:MAG: hybrid sensor histidine kinase/response regulator, partial [Cephaloticoccus sp.]